MKTDFLVLKNQFFKSLDDLYPEEEINSLFFWGVDRILNMNRLQVATDPHLKIAVAEQNKFQELILALKNKVPIQYFFGETLFYGLQFKINSSVLIPRPETEELVEHVIKYAKNLLNSKQLKILDVGTGSGCIAIALKKLLPQSEVWAVDISNEALEMARINAELNKVSVKFLSCDILSVNSSPKNQRDVFAGHDFDIIVSNPPYVRELEMSEMNDNVLNFEPKIALFVEDSKPLVFYEEICDLALNKLTENGVVFFEINQYLGLEMQFLLKSKGFTDIELTKDLFGNNRFIKGMIS